MVRVRLYGGLGNQMFQYAAAYTLAHKMDRPLQLETLTASSDGNCGILAQAFPIPETIAVRQSAPLNLARRVQRRLNIPEKGVWREQNFHFDESLQSLRDPVTLDGYFQSWRYFASSSHDIRGLFSLRDPSPYFLSTQSRIDEAPISISMHVRRGDYLTAHAQRVHGSLDLEYYSRGMDLLSRFLAAPVTIFVFSDDPDWVLTNMPRFETTVVVDGAGDRPWEDMLLMSKCDHHIIANSSFSWWGAWLAEPRHDRCIIAPRQWFTPETLRQKNTTDLYPSHWWLL
jgi:hypothetical protein